MHSPIYPHKPKITAGGRGRIISSHLQYSCHRRGSEYVHFSPHGERGRGTYAVLIGVRGEKERERQGERERERETLIKGKNVYECLLII